MAIPKNILDGLDLSTIGTRVPGLAGRRSQRVANKVPTILRMPTEILTNILELALTTRDGIGEELVVQVSARTGNRLAVVRFPRPQLGYISVCHEIYNLGKTMFWNKIVYKFSSVRALELFVTKALTPHGRRSCKMPRNLSLAGIQHIILNPTLALGGDLFGSAMKLVDHAQDIKTLNLYTDLSGPALNQYQRTIQFVKALLNAYKTKTQKLRRLNRLLDFTSDQPFKERMKILGIHEVFI